MAFEEKSVGDGSYAQLKNINVHSFAWKDITVTVKARDTKQPKVLLDNVSGIARAGELLALMGPSGSGKTTLLNVLANRVATIEADIRAGIYLNGASVDPSITREIAAYVEQDDALVGSLTVSETLDFAARLSLPKSISKDERLERIKSLLDAFGLRAQASTLVGTPIRKGISGGQKRRLSVAAQLITSPKLLFLDEPTSGLDSAAAFEVISFIRAIAKRYRLIVIASIHQPSTATFSSFDKLLLLSQGHTAYSGSVTGVQQFFGDCGFPVPAFMNPAEFIIDYVNTDFNLDEGDKTRQLDLIKSNWTMSQLREECDTELSKEFAGNRANGCSIDFQEPHASPIDVQLALISRSYIKSRRDIIAYGIRVAMYMGLAIMMGTVWLRLAPKQENIGSFINAIFFGGAFMSFMAVAYIPAFLEDRALFIKERANGLYGPAAFMVSNFVIGLPYLFIISLLFSIIAYWLSNFRPTGQAFFTWVMWLFLDLIAAESLVVLVTSVVPLFVVALAVTAFANGLWMCTNGFLVPPQQLNSFWYYVFHFIDYQAYVFQGMMINEFTDRVYDCTKQMDGSCTCMYPSPLMDQCQIPGKAVLDMYNYSENRTGKWVGIMLVIVLAYRCLAWAVLRMRRD
ncbi:putative ABC transporter [Myriangium duriaei CBS 260.36]|uniref:ABC transporter n=1 Tax=Myriangium duriaei CBS 260.36 TaxID=1168546 RepID=A0A9P4MDS0_9PEZI|nr:putative ABC transporter [Myriangium duriaei CBS 260.36]